jgi:phage N-6-adenine-methyltransferase
VNTALMFSTGTDDWRTPPELFAALDAEFRFTLDAAATRANALCPLYLGPDHAPEYRDALTTDWWIGRSGEAAYCNPPYSRGLQGKFIAKAALEAHKGAGGLLTVVMLIPARPDTKAFHAHIWDAEKHQPREGVEVRFLKGRLKFSGAKDAAPFPSMVVVFRGTHGQPDCGLRGDPHARITTGVD